MRAEDLRPAEFICLEEQTGFPMSGPHRVMAIGISTFVQLEKDLIRSLGWRKMSIIFTRLGYQWGLAQAKAIGRLYDFDSKEEWLKAGSVLTKFSGLADEEIHEINFDAETNQLHFSGTWRNSFEALMVRSDVGLRPDPVCRILAGIASGFASEVFGLEVLVRETSCQATGSNNCTFEGRPVEDWDPELMDVKQYFAVTYLDEELAHTSLLLQQAQEDMARQECDDLTPKSMAYKPECVDGMVFRSDSMAKALLLAQKVAPTSSTVLIQGESGTGKEVLARFIHRHSGRLEDPFMAINCAALPPNLLESELFGHVKGSFTGADSDKKGLFVEAGEGTLFLDEVGELPLELQAKLLRALQDKAVRPVGGVKNAPVRARILAASNRDLMEMVQDNSFREDLYYRLAVFPLLVTPLRERRQDILILARHFLTKLNSNHPGFAPETVRRLESYSWPGNVRELENWVEYAVVMAGEERILPEHLPMTARGGSEDPLSTLAMDLPTSEELEKRYIRLVLERTENNKTEAAGILGLSISTLWRRLKE